MEREYVQKNNRQTESAEEAEQLKQDAVEQVQDKKTLSDEHLKEIDDLLDEIDEILEENASEFVNNFIQKGGE